MITSVRRAASPGRSITAYQPQGDRHVPPSTLLAIVLSVTALLYYRPGGGIYRHATRPGGQPRAGTPPMAEIRSYKYTTVGRTMYPMPHMYRNRPLSTQAGPPK